MKLTSRTAHNTGSDLLGRNRRALQQPTQKIELENYILQIWSLFSSRSELSGWNHILWNLELVVHK